MASFTDPQLREILLTSPTIAVVGIHNEPEKAAYYVPEYLHDEGYRIFGINPRFAGEELFGNRVRAQLRDLEEQIDLVDIFRISRAVPGHVDDILAMKHKPKVVWLQLGIKSDEAAQRLEAAGITVVQNRCTLADHQRLGMGKPNMRAAAG